jgi:hypothetical protein
MISKNIKIGEKLSVTNYYTVTDSSEKEVNVTDYKGNKFSIGKRVIDDECHSASQFEETETVTRTKIVELVENAGHTIMTVTFTKQPTIDSVLEIIESESENLSGGTKKKKKEIVKSLLAGEERVMIATLLRNGKEESGRIKVVDMEIEPPKYAMRLIDTRTISSLILENVKYVVK